MGGGRYLSASTECRADTYPRRTARGRLFEVLGPGIVGTIDLHLLHLCCNPYATSAFLCPIRTIGSPQNREVVESASPPLTICWLKSHARGVMTITSIQCTSVVIWENLGQTAKRLLGENKRMIDGFFHPRAGLGQYARLNP